MNQKKTVIGEMLTLMRVGNSFIAKFLVPVNFTLLLVANLKLFGFNFSLPTLVILFTLALTSSFMLGFIYDKLGFWKYEVTFDNERNPILHEVRDLRSDIKDLMSKNYYLVKKK